MNVLAQMRKAVLGETWALPIGVALLVGAAVLLKQVAPDPWPTLGGPLLVAGAIVLLGILVARGARGG